MTAERQIVLSRAAKFLGLTPGSMKALVEARGLTVVQKYRVRRLLMSEVEPLVNDDWVLVYRGEAPPGWMFAVDALGGYPNARRTRVHHQTHDVRPLANAQAPDVVQLFLPRHAFRPKPLPILETT